MKALNGIVKKIGKTKLIGLIVILVVIIGGVGGYMAYGQKKHSPEFTATENIVDKLKQEKSKKVILVFFSKGSDYSQAGSSTVLEEANKVDYPVYYVDFDSPERGEVLSLLQASDEITGDMVINTASLLIHRSTARNAEIIQYADQVNGKYVPLTENIKNSFEK